MLRQVTLLGLLLTLGQPLQAQDDPRGLLDRAMKSHGGEAQLARFKARHHKTRGTLYIGNGISFTQDVFYQMPSQIKDVMQAEVNGKKLTIVILLDGDKGSIFVDGQAQEVGDKLVTEMKEAAHLARVTRLAPLKDKAYTLTNAGASQVQGRPALGLKVAAKSFRDILLSFDKESGLLVKSERKVYDKVSDQFVTEETFYDHWKDIDGVKTPMRVVVQRNGKKFSEAEVLELKHLDKLEEGIFAKP